MFPDISISYVAQFLYSSLTLQNGVVSAVLQTIAAIQIAMSRNGL